MECNNGFPCCATRDLFKEAVSEVSLGQFSLHQSSDSVESLEKVPRTQGDSCQIVRTGVNATSELQAMQPRHPIFVILGSVLPRTSSHIARH